MITADRVLTIDPPSGELEVEAGISLDRLINLLVPSPRLSADALTGPTHGFGQYQLVVPFGPEAMREAMVRISRSGAASFLHGSITWNSSTGQVTVTRA